MVPSPKPLNSRLCQSQAELTLQHALSRVLKPRAGKPFYITTTIDCPLCSRPALVQQGNCPPESASVYLLSTKATNPPGSKCARNQGRLTNRVYYPSAAEVRFIHGRACITLYALQSHLLEVVHQSRDSVASFTADGSVSQKLVLTPSKPCSLSFWPSFLLSFSHCHPVINSRPQRPVYAKPHPAPV